MSYTEVYIDPSIGTDSGSGTAGDPFGNTQYALDNSTFDSTNGTRFNIRDSAADLLSATLDTSTFASVWSSAANIRTVFEGYTSVPGDGGLAELQFAGTIWDDSSIWRSLFRRIRFNGIGIASGTFCNFGAIRSGVVDCEFINAGGADLGITMNSDSFFVGNKCLDFNGTEGIRVGTNNIIVGNYFSGSATRLVRTNTAQVSRNLLAYSGANYAISLQKNSDVNHNSIIATSASAGAGIMVDAWTGYTWNTMFIRNNIITGFSAAGGRGIDFSYSGIAGGAYSGNAVYDCETDYAGSPGDGWGFGPLADNESLAADPFARSGSNTFANRFAYYAPNDVGNVLSGGLKRADGTVVISGTSKGAVQGSISGGGSTTKNVFVIGEQ